VDGKQAFLRGWGALKSPDDLHVGYVHIDDYGAYTGIPLVHLLALSDPSSIHLSSPGRRGLSVGRRLRGYDGLLRRVVDSSGCDVIRLLSRYGCTAA
jgi:hypothetical protein